MKFEVKIIKPEFDINPEKSKTNNYDWRRLLVVNFKEMRTETEDKNGFKTIEFKNFQWIPSYKQLCEIYRGLEKAEELNKELCKVWAK